MPIVAVVAGIAGAAGAASGAAALLGGAFSLANVAAGLAFVGGVSTALGAVTGNKKLQKFGMITGLGGAALGGIASLASGGASVAAPAGAVLDAGSVGAEAASLTGADLALTGGAGAAPGSTMLPSGNGLLSTAGAPPALGAGNPSFLATRAAAADAAVAAAPSTVPAAAVTAAPPQVAGDSVGNVGSTGQAFAQAKGLLGSVGSVIESNPGLAKIGLGALSAVGEARSAKSAREEAVRQMEAERDRLNRSISAQRANF